MTLLERLELFCAKLRIRMNVCPECNSDAPELDHCPVCEGYRDGYPPADHIKGRWLLNWMHLHDKKDKTT